MLRDQEQDNSNNFGSSSTISTGSRSSSLGIGNAIFGVVITLVLVFAASSLLRRNPKNTSVPTATVPTATQKKSVLDTGPFHFETWSYGPGRGQGVDIQFTSYEIEPDRITLFFSVKSGDHEDLLLYAPKSVKDGFGSNCEALYIVDNNGEKFYSTSGWRGGRQSNFNSCTMQIKFDPNEMVVLSADFPWVSSEATSIKFVSPNPDNAGHQSEWYWQGIRVRNNPLNSELPTAPILKSPAAVQEIGVKSALGS